MRSQWETAFMSVITPVIEEVQEDAQNPSESHGGIAMIQRLREMASK